MLSYLNAQAIMMKFAADTGLTNKQIEPRRYLWTDAFAVCNFLQLYKLTDEQHFLRMATDLVEQVHHVLGQFRAGQALHNHNHNHHNSHIANNSQGHWLSGLDDKQAKLHPTCAGLRIGKQLDERKADEPVDQKLEWHQDGQYFHYLTKWMHTLSSLSRETGNDQFIRWALELAKAAHNAFVYDNPHDNSRRMYWKMSVDLSRPLVESMGQHDPLDGLITYSQLQATADKFPQLAKTLRLDKEIKEMETICKGHNWSTLDTLGIGGLLSDCYTLLQLLISPDSKKLRINAEQKLVELLIDSRFSLKAFTIHNSLGKQVSHRLPFRELGLSIGLHAVNRMQEKLKQQPSNLKNCSQLIDLVQELQNYRHLLPLIEKFWLDPNNQQEKTWQEHLDINSVMLVTSLLPDGYLDL